MAQNGFGCIFEHIQFNIPVFARKEQNCANFVRKCANYVPDFESGKKFSKMAMLSLEVYPHKMELRASIASCRN